MPQATAQPTHQEQLDKLQHEVQSLREQLRHAQRLATVGTMTAMVAHEFNNILTPIINYAQMAQNNPALSGKAIAKAADGGQRASDICKALLGMTRDSCRPAPVDLSQLAAETLRAMVRDPRKDGIEIVTDIPADLCVTARKVELQQVLLNLLINARTAVLTQGGTCKRIAIAARRHGAWVVLSVKDSGVGIAPENLPRIFEPFFTTSSSQDDGPGGHGLGLAICREIIADAGGEISVQSTPGQGAAFTVRLPA